MTTTTDGVSIWVWIGIAISLVNHDRKLSTMRTC